MLLKVNNSNQRLLFSVPPTPHPIKNIRLSTEGNSTSFKHKLIVGGTKDNLNDTKLVRVLLNTKPSQMIFISKVKNGNSQ